MIDIISRLFGRKKQLPESVQTAPLSPDQLETVTAEPLRFFPPQLVVGTAQSVGRQRDHNEDCLFAMSSMISGSENSLPFGIFMVADGMGGHENGEVASNVAVRTLSTYLMRKIYLPYIGIRTDMGGEPLQEILQTGVREAQQAVLRLAPRGGTTLTAAFILGDQLTIAHVGDSRAYFIFPDGRMQAVTRDHSLVRRLMELGQITEKEAAVHPQRNVLYRAIGQGEPFDPDVNTYLMPHPGYLMLCSDGLWGVISEMDMFSIITGAENPSKACHNLVEAANAAGGPDNISVILAQYPN
ncbi:MAG TPA: protein phosphatase 2C domain-containing protein [Anaerolineaceae bacterium]|nr:protein phosphatase 2C domain-containing protein [Anaerolineaceae bacterium]